MFEDDRNSLSLLPPDTDETPLRRLTSGNADAALHLV